MSLHLHFEVIGPHAYCRLSGRADATDRAGAIEGAIRRALDLRATALIVNVTELEDATPPTFDERYERVRQWATIAGDKLRVAKVTLLDLSSRDFEARVADKFGLNAAVFASELDAVAWLEFGCAAVTGCC